MIVHDIPTVLVTSFLALCSVPMKMSACDTHTPSEQQQCDHTDDVTYELACMQFMTLISINYYFYLSEPIQISVCVQQYDHDTNPND